MVMLPMSAVSSVMKQIMDRLAYIDSLSPPLPCSLILERLHTYHTAIELERFCLSVSTPQKQGFSLIDETA